MPKYFHNRISELLHTEAYATLLIIDSIPYLGNRISASGKQKASVATILRRAHERVYRRFKNL